MTHVLHVPTYVYVGLKDTKETGTAASARRKMHLFTLQTGYPTHGRRPQSVEENGRCFYRCKLTKKKYLQSTASPQPVDPLGLLPGHEKTG
jgi:hypothetical protein